MNYDLARAKRYCVWLLSRREQSEYELKQKLRAKGCEEDLCREALSWVKEMGFQSDERCASAKARSESKRKGNYLVKQKLESIGLDKDLVSQVLEEQPEETERIKDLCQKFEGKLVDEKAYSKALRYLVSRGFPYQASKKELDEVKSKG